MHNQPKYTDAHSVDVNNETVNVVHIKHATFPMSIQDLKTEDRKNLRFFYTSRILSQEAFGYTVGLLCDLGQFFSCYRP